MVKLSVQVSTDEGERMANEIKAAKYCECSAVTTEGVREMFEIAARLTLTKSKNKFRKGRCILL